MSLNMMLGSEDLTLPVVLLDNSSESVEMSNDVEVNSDSQRLLLQSINNNYVRMTMMAAELLQCAANNGGKHFNIFFK